MLHRTPRLRRPGPIVVAAIVTAAWGLAFFPAPPSTRADTPDPVIAAAGDIACDPASSSFNNGDGTTKNCHQKKTAALLTTDLAAVLPLGDNQYYCGGLSAFLASYDQSWGAAKPITRPAVGNHEYLTSGGTGCDASNAGAAGHFAYFGAAAGNPGAGYYSFDIGAWHLIALNSNCSSAGGCGSTSPQGRWLAADLAAHPTVCTLAYWHIPLFSSGGRASSNSKSFWNQLYAAGADLILTGHDHIYERFARQTPTGQADPASGIREFVVGTGGANHTSIATVAPNSEVRDSTTYGVLRLALHPQGYDWQFVPESGGTFTDSGSEACVGAGTSGPDVSPPTTPTGLVATGVATDRISLTWQASTDNVGVAGYTVTRDGIAIATVAAAPQSYLDTGLGPGSSHSYTVEAFDAAGNRSAPSAPVVATTLPVDPQVSTVTVVADAYVSAANPTQNYGLTTALRTDGSPILRSYLRFDLSAIAGTVTRATLRFLPNANHSQGLEVHQSTATSWSETGITFENAPSYDASILATSGALVSGVWTSMDATVAATGSTVTVVLTTTSPTQASLASRQTSNPPVLVVESVP